MGEGRVMEEAEGAMEVEVQGMAIRVADLVEDVMGVMEAMTEVKTAL